VEKGEEGGAPPESRRGRRDRGERRGKGSGRAAREGRGTAEAARERNPERTATGGAGDVEREGAPRATVAPEHSQLPSCVREGGGQRGEGHQRQRAEGTARGSRHGTGKERGKAPDRTRSTGGESGRPESRREEGVGGRNGRRRRRGGWGERVAKKPADA